MKVRIGRTLIFFLFLCANSTSFSQSTWVMRISNSDTINSGINAWSVTTVGNTINLVFNEAFDGFYKFVIVQLDIDGEIIAYNYYGENGVFEHAGWANSADVSNEGGVINAGSYSIDDGPSFGHIKSFDANAELLWERLYGDTIQYNDGSYGGNIFRQVKSTSDGGYIAVGQAGVVQYHPRIWVVKTDAQGEVEWQNYYGVTGPNSYYDGFHISETPAGDYVFAGYYDWEPFVTSGIVYRVNSEGQILNTATTSLGEVPNGSCDGILVLDNNDIITGTQLNFIGEDGGDMQFTRVHRLDPTLQNIWVSEVGENWRTTAINHMLRVDPNSMVCAGTARTYDEFPLFYGHLTKMNLDDGSIIWQRLLSVVDNGMNMMFDVDHAPDGGFVTAGWCLAIWDDEHTGQQDAWVAKTDEHGCIVPGCHVGVLENEATAAFKLYPNPARDIVNLYLETDQHRPRGTITIHDLQGREVKNFPAPQSETTYIIDISMLTPSIYVITYSDNQVYVTERLIVSD